jgi:hypothetical protein
MSNYVTELVLNTKLAILMSASGLTAYFVELMTSYDSIILKGSATVSFITLIVVAYARYCKIVRENRESLERSRINELEADRQTAEKEKIELEKEGERLENIHKDLVIKEQLLRIKQLEKSIGDNDGSDKQG